MIYATVSKRSAGFTIVEVLMAVGVLGLLGFAAAALIGKMSQETAGGASQRGLLELTKQVRRQISETKSVNSPSAPCTPSFSLDTAITPAFNGSSSARNAVRMTVDGVTYRQGATLTQPNINIAAFYLSDTLQIGTTAGGRTNYLSTLYVSASTNPLLRRAREVATISIEVDAASGQITQCHVATSATAAKDACDKSFGMRWNANTNRCNQAMADDATTTTFDCPPGFKGAPPNCLPIPSSCASGQVARGFHLGQVRDCVLPPTSASGVVARAPEDLTRPANDPLPPPAPSGAPTQPAFSAPATVSTTTSTSASAPSNCSDGTAASRLSADACMGSPSLPGINFYQNTCLWPTTPTVASSCETKPAVSYKTPDLSIKPPDAPAPNDMSCQCNNRRIANGEYCMYCIDNADLGFGYADFTYGVTRCSSGNLIDVPSPAFGACSTTYRNTYGRARYTGGRFYQNNEIP